MTRDIPFTLQNLFLGRTITQEDNPESGPFTAICAAGVDGTVADVYGETEAETELTAKQIVSVLSWLLNDELREKYAEEVGAKALHRIIFHNERLALIFSGLQEMRSVDWENLGGLKKQLLTGFIASILGEFAIWTLSEDGGLNLVEKERRGVEER